MKPSLIRNPPARGTASRSGTAHWCSSSAAAEASGALLDRAVARATAAGFASVTVACEPTDHRWRVLDQQAAEPALPLVCVQPLLAWRAREAERVAASALGRCQRRPAGRG